MLRRWSLLVVFSFTLFTSSLRAQDTTPPAEPNAPLRPIALMTFASIERFLTDIDWTFETAGRPELTDFVAAQLGNVNDLKGVDRDKPFGVMLFLKPGFPPRPTPVGFLPITDIEDLAKTIGLGPVKMEKIEGKQNRYEMKGRRRNGTIMVQDGYALISSDETLFDEENIPNPVPIVEALATRYDFSINLRIREIPETTRAVVVGFLKTSFAAEMQQRDEEPESLYKIRKANGQSTLEALTAILSDGDQFTLGWDASKENKSGVLEWKIDATPNSGLSKYIKDVGGKPTTFHAMMADDRPLTIAAAWTMDKRERKTAKIGVEGAMQEVNKVLNDGEYVETLHPGLQKIQDVALATIEDGVVDFCIQMVNIDTGKFALVGGARVAGGDTLGVGIRETLKELKDRPELQALDLDDAAHNNVSFHRIIGPKPRDGETKFYGGEPAAWVGAGGRNIWFCVGTTAGLDALKSTMDLVAEGGPPTPKTASAPFQIVFRMAPWLQIPPDADADTEDLDLAKDAFGAQTDAARLEVRPVDNGLRTRLQFDEGFIRWLGMTLAKQIDSIGSAE
jgi:hypothetical protein